MNSWAWERRKKSKLSVKDIGVSAVSKINYMAQSKRTLSSPTLSSSDKVSDCRDSTGALNSHPEFVNQGLLLWNQTRQQWVESKKTEIQPDLREPRISWSATYDSLLGTNKPFRKPIPLFEMVDFLLDIWEEEGLYD